MKGVGPESRRWGLTFGAAALLLAVAVLSAPLRGVGHGVVETSPSLGVDAEPSGNSATSLKDIDRCVSVGMNATFSIDLWIMDVTDLSGWQAHFQYDGSLLSVVGIEAEMFQAANPGSQVLDLSDPVPDSDGNYFAAAADLVIEASDSGSGVLARVTLEAKGSGRAAVGLTSPLLANKDGMPIGDTDGDTYFDGPMYDAEIAIALPCSGGVASPTATPTPAGTLSPTPTPTPAGTCSPTPVASPTQPGVFSQLTSGWNYVCYVGPGLSPGDALAGIVDEIQAMYRLGPGQAFERWFPDRPELSTIVGVAPGEALFILTSGSTVWAQQPSALPTSANLGQGWNDVCYLGNAKSPADATAGIANQLGILYVLGSDHTWTRYVPGRPEVSNTAQLEQYNGVLLLMTEPGAIAWMFDP